MDSVETDKIPAEPTGAYSGETDAEPNNVNNRILIFIGQLVW